MNKVMGVVLVFLALSGGCDASNCPTQCKSGVCLADGGCRCSSSADCQLLHAYCDGIVCIPAPDGGGAGGGAGGGIGGGGGSDAGP